MNSRKFLSVTTFLVVASMVLAACGGMGTSVLSTGTQTGDYVSPILQTKMIGSSVGAGIGWGILALVLALIVGGVTYFFMWRLDEKSRKNFPVAIAAALVIFGLVFGGAYFNASYITIDAGEVGVVVDQGKAIDSLDPGQHWITGFTQKVVIFSTREFTFSTLSDPLNQGSEQYRTYTMSMVTSDGVDGRVPFQIVSQLDSKLAMEVYSEYGTLENAIVQQLKTPALEEVRDVIRGQLAEDIITNIDDFNDDVEERLKVRIGENGLLLISFGFRAPDLGEWQVKRNAAQVAIQAALEAKNLAEVTKAQQEGRKAEADGSAAVQLIQAQANADSQIIAANAQAEVAKIEADGAAYSTLTKAEAEAKANIQVANSLTAALIEYRKWLLWDGKLPSTMLGDSSNLLYSIPQ